MVKFMTENLRAKAQEWQSLIRTRVEEIRTGVSSPGHSPLLGKLGVLGEGGGIFSRVQTRLAEIRGTHSSGSPEILTTIREKGVLGAAMARIEKVRPVPAAPAPPAPPEVPTVYERRKVSLE